MSSNEPVKRPPAEFYDYNDSDNDCFLCDNPRYTPLHEVRHFGFPISFQRCACGLVKQTPMPNQDFFDWFFNSDLFVSAKQSGSEEVWGFYDYMKDEPSRLLTSKRRYRKFRHYFPERHPLDILKIGPTTGTFLHVAASHGHRAIGCDISSRFIRHARETYGVEILEGRFEQLGFSNAAFDVILLLNVLENLPNPAELIAEVRRTLRPGGLFIFNYVDMKHNWLAALQKKRYFLYRPPVCYIFDRDVIANLLLHSGFEAVATLRDTRYLTVEKIVTLLGWRWLLRLAERLKVAGLTYSLWAYPSRIVVARKVNDAVKTD